MKTHESAGLLHSMFLFWFIIVLASYLPLVFLKERKYPFTIPDRAYHPLSFMFWMIYNHYESDVFQVMMMSGVFQFGTDHSYWFIEYLRSTKLKSKPYFLFINQMISLYNGCVFCFSKHDIQGLCIGFYNSTSILSFHSFFN